MHDENYTLRIFFFFNRLQSAGYNAGHTRLGQSTKPRPDGLTKGNIKLLQVCVQTQQCGENPGLPSTTTTTTTTTATTTTTTSTVERLLKTRMHSLGPVVASPSERGRCPVWFNRVGSTGAASTLLYPGEACVPIASLPQIRPA